MHVRKLLTTAALALALTIGSAGAAWADPSPGTPTRLPDGWHLTTTKDGQQLTWRAPARIPLRDAVIEFYAGNRLLGRPKAVDDQRGFQLDLYGVAALDLTGLQVRAAGRRLDVADNGAGSGPASAAPAATTVLPPNTVDPGTTGPYATISGEYQLPDVQLPGYAQPVEMQAVVVAPTGVSGSRPLVLFLHGRHDTCYTGSSTSGVWPCPAGYSPIPSYRGYLQAQQLLASQGYVTVSISANGISGQDGLGIPPDDGGAQARSSLVRLHLGHWADWAGSGRSSAPAIVRSAPVANMSQVLLFGHSRGGEGVNRAALDSLNPPVSTQDGYHAAVSWQIRGMVLVGPTITGQNPAADVPTVSILPGCDGDISDLQGEMYVDGTRGVSRGSALHSAVYVSGANHNYFNTEWTPGQAQARAFDDYIGHDPYCTSTSSSRLTYQQQQNMGATYIAAAARLFVAGDDAVRPLLDGSGYRAVTADPASVLTHAVGANRTALVVPSSTTTVSGTGARLCQEVRADASTDCITKGVPDSPHFALFGPIRPETGRYAAAVTWSTPGTRTSFKPAQAVSVSSATSVALRLIAPVNTTGTSVEVAITDTSGRRATLGQVTLDGLPSPTYTAANWAQEVRLPLTAARNAGLNLSQIAALELVPLSASGELCLVDAWGWRAGTPAPQPVALPRVDLGELTVDEGNSGTTTYQIPTRVSGSGSAQVRVFVVDPVTNQATAQVVTVPSGSTTISIPVPVTGDTVPGNGRTYVVAVKALQGAEIGDAYGALVVRDDDPAS